ncbi:MAG: AMP-binding protein, partial [Anaerolineae bacterium]|nr:AMP-binding protein [Anaerolineae bacterium]
MLGRSTRSRYQSLLDAHALSEDRPDDPAVILVQTGQEPQVIPRVRFRELVQQYASALQNLGMQSGDVLVIAHLQSLESMLAFWGALRIGAIPSMFPTLTEKLDAHHYLRNMAQLVELSAIRAVFTTDEFASELRAHLPCPIFDTQSLSAAKEYVESPSAAPDEHAIAFLQHSSGTTGLQKGVALSHYAVLNQLASYSDRLQLRAEDVIISWLPLYHDMGLIAGFLLPLVQGIPLVLMSPFDWVRSPALLMQAIDRYQGTLCWLPNFAYNHCARRIRAADMDGLSLASMRAWINCSEPVRHASHQLFLERFGSLGIRPET